MTIKYYSEFKILTYVNEYKAGRITPESDESTNSCVRVQINSTTARMSNINAQS